MHRRDDNQTKSFGELYSQMLDFAFNADANDMPLLMSLLVGPILALVVVTPVWLYFRIFGR